MREKFENGSRGAGLPQKINEQDAGSRETDRQRFQVETTGRAEERERHGEDG